MFEGSLAKLARSMPGFRISAGEGLAREGLIQIAAVAVALAFPESRRIGVITA
jgi:hypothetical protein